MVNLSLSRFGTAVLDLVYPPRCALCARYGSFLCDRCAVKLPRADGQRCERCWLPIQDAYCRACRENPVVFESLRCVYRYQGDVRRLVHAFKFGGQSSLGRALGQKLAACYRDEGLESDVVVPVPLTPRRRRERGYNQAALLTRELAGKLGLPVSEALRRGGDSPHQAQSAGAEQRRRNVIGAFEVERAREVEGRAVLLVDDVATTGATLSACAAILLDAGAKRVVALTLARED